MSEPAGAEPDALVREHLPRRGSAGRALALASQYEIALPTDYDMSIIRSRVEWARQRFDHRVGLGLKAFLICDVARGSTANAYAPFSVWKDAGAAGDFLWRGEGFGAIVADFGRPEVRIWPDPRIVRGRAAGARPTFALREFVSFAADADPTAAVSQLEFSAQELAEDPRVHSVVWGADPTGWTGVLLSLVTERVERPNAIEYEIAHLSAPSERI